MFIPLRLGEGCFYLLREQLSLSERSIAANNPSQPLLLQIARADGASKVRWRIKAGRNSVTDKRILLRGICSSPFIFGSISLFS